MVGWQCWIKHLPNHNPCGNCAAKPRCSGNGPLLLANGFAALGFATFDCSNTFCCCRGYLLRTWKELARPQKKVESSTILVKWFNWIDLPFYNILSKSYPQFVNMPVPVITFTVNKIPCNKDVVHFHLSWPLHNTVKSVFTFSPVFDEVHRCKAF
jgi:hypothetical protein